MGYKQKERGMQFANAGDRRGISIGQNGLVTSRVCGVVDIGARPSGSPSLSGVIARRFKSARPHVPFSVSAPEGRNTNVFGVVEYTWDKLPPTPVAPSSGSLAYQFTFTFGGG